MVHIHAAIRHILSPPFTGGLGLVGLIGGALHCAPMCGPFVLAQGSRRSATSARASQPKTPSSKASTGVCGTSC
ncbi:MAG: hypothetical protein EXQ98_06025 [Alphaproteobacteria bacterium]|nr:hypothetical protein [Alphaproteobacteria bacterium]